MAEVELTSLVRAEDEGEGEDRSDNLETTDDSILDGMEHNEDSHTEGRGRGFPVRATMAVLCLFANVVCYADRANIAVAIVPMADEFGWSGTKKGLVLGAFFGGYACTQLPGGLLAKAYGAKTVLSCGVVAWSTFTLLTPLAADVSLPWLIATRVCMGLGEGVSLPSIHTLAERYSSHNILSLTTISWFPVHERSRAVSAMTSGHYLGTVAAYLSAPLAARWWPGVFYGFGAVGFVWVGCFWYLGGSSPKLTRYISRDEVDYIEQHTPRPAADHKFFPLRQIFTCPAVWAIIVAHFCFNYGNYVILSWMSVPHRSTVIVISWMALDAPALRDCRPSYFEHIGIPFKDVGYFSILPWTVSFICSNVGGVVADTLVRKYGLSIMNAVCFGGAAVSLGLLALTTSSQTKPMAMFLFTTAVGFAAFSHSAFWVNIIDIAPHHAGAVLGISNTIATIPGVVGNIVTGALLDHYRRSSSPAV